MNRQTCPQQSKPRDELDEKLARISTRFETRRSEVRSRLQAAPQLVACLDAIKATFGEVKLRYVKVGDWEQGQEMIHVKHS